MIQVSDLSQTGRPLARRPANGQYHLNPPVPVPSPDRFQQDLQGSSEDRTGVQGIFEIDEINMLACPDLMRAYQVGLISLDQVQGLMGLMLDMCEGSLKGDVPNPPNRMVVLDT